jgi:hypothetical protein
MDSVVKRYTVLEIQQDKGWTDAMLLSFLLDYIEDAPLAMGEDGLADLLRFLAAKADAPTAIQRCPKCGFDLVEESDNSGTWYRCPDCDED